MPRREPAPAVSDAPISEAPAPAPSLTQPAAADSPTFPEAVAFDDIPELIAMIDSMPVAPSSAAAAPALPGPGSQVDAPPLEPPSAPPALSAMSLTSARQIVPTPPPILAAPSSGPVRRGSSGDALLLVSRKAVYAQAALMAVVALAALTAGYLIGRGGRPAVSSSTAVAAGEGEPVALEGHIGYTFATDASVPDAGAVVAVLPAKKQPAHKLEAALFRPGEADESTAAARESVEALGGALAKAGDDGQFQLVVPRPGDYFLLILSRHAERPSDLPIAPKHLAKLSSYFDSPTELIADKRYAWLSRRLAGAPPPVRHEFREK